MTQRIIDNASLTSTSLSLEGRGEGVRVQSARTQGPRAASLRSGMTFVELMVAMGVLVILLGIFNVVLSQSRRVVSVTQAQMRANSEVTAISETIRNDLRRISRNGFLCITQDGPNGPPQLLFTTAGPSASLTTPSGSNFNQVIGTGTITAFGLCTGSNGTPVFWRSAWVLNKDAGEEADIIALDMIRFQTEPRYHDTEDDINGDVDTIRGKAPANLPVPPNEPSEMWKYLMTNCSRLEIHWTDGTLKGGSGADANQLNWRGLQLDGTNQYQLDPPDNTLVSDAMNMEYLADDGGYRALWTHEDQNNWPTAIRIRFTLLNKDLPSDLQNMEYEIICPVGQ